MTRRPAVRLAVAMVATALLPACTTDVLLVRDDRLEITSPADRAEVTLPFTVRWRNDNPAVGSFLVLVDRAPMPPGETVAAFGVTDALDGVHPLPDQPPLTATELTIDSLPPRGTLPPDQQDRYEITVIWLDRAGRRLTENADYVTVEVKGGAR